MRRRQAGRRSVQRIDELILKVNPVLIGSGVPLFARAVDTPRARALERQLYPNGFVLARYDLAGAPHPVDGEVMSPSEGGRI